MVKILITCILLIIPNLVIAQTTEQINPQDPNYNVELNAILQTIGANNTTNQNNINTLQGYFSNNILGTANGGLGQNASAWTTGDVVYLSGTGVFSHETIAALVPPVLSNVVYSWTGVEDQHSSDLGLGYGLYTGTGTTPNTNFVFSNLFFATGTSINSNQIMLRSRFKKISSINTLTIAARAWVNGGSTTGKVRVDVDSLNGISAGFSNTSPGWQNEFTIDVSGLTNNTSYDLTVGIYNTATQNTYLDSIIIFGS